MESKLVSALVDRFLTWPLPESVCADRCASEPNVPAGIGVPVPRRTGTNLLNAEEARQMIEYLLASDLHPVSGCTP